jgi:hypothetical protein
MAIFLNREQIYRILQRELPEGIYPDGSPDQYVSTAENDSIAGTISGCYATMQEIYTDLFPQTANSLEKWEAKIFGETSVGNLSITDRRNYLLSGLRSQANISYWTIITTIASILPLGCAVEVRNYSLHFQYKVTGIKGNNADLVWNDTWQAGDPAPEGVTVTDDIRNNYSSMVAVRAAAYRYDVVLYGTNITSELVSLVESTLNNIEPARSTHTLKTILLNLTPTTIVATESNVENFESIYRDENSISGYFIPSLAGSSAYYFGFDGDTFALGFGDYYDITVGGLWYDYSE